MEEVDPCNCFGNWAWVKEIEVVGSAHREIGRSMYNIHISAQRGEYAK